MEGLVAIWFSRLSLSSFLVCEFVDESSKTPSQLVSRLLGSFLCLSVHHIRACSVASDEMKESDTYFYVRMPYRKNDQFLESNSLR